YGIEHRLQVAGRTRNDAQHLRGRGLLLQRLSELLFQLSGGLARLADARTRLRSGRTRLAAACWALCAFERQGHLVGTVTGPLFRSAQPRIEPIDPNRTAR